MTTLAVDPVVSSTRVTARWLWLVLGLAGLVLLRALAAARLPLAPEEAYYWMYAQHPSLSYFDHPPMIAWLIAITTHFLGHSELAVRLSCGLLTLATSPLLYLYARPWYGCRSALIAALALQFLPVYFGFGLISTMDGAMLFFWTLSLLATSRLLRMSQPAPGPYVLLALSLGAALLTKYTAIALLPGLLLVFLSHSTYRHHLRTPYPYLAVLLALAMTAPVLLWNFQHDFASFRFQFSSRFEGHSLRISHLLSFTVYQLALITPLGFLALAFFVRNAFTRFFPLPPRYILALAFSLPLLAVMAWKSLTYPIHLSWTAPAYLSLLPAGIHALRSATRLRTRSFPLHPAMLPATATLCAATTAALLLYLLLVQPHSRALSAFNRWPELAAIVESHEETLEAATGREPLIVVDGKYRLASVLAFYRTPLETKVPASQFTTSQWIIEGSGLGYEYWLNPQDFQGADLLYLTDSPTSAEISRISPRFSSIETIHDPRLSQFPSLRLLLCRNFHAAR